jgi:hypothetical protein
MVAKVMLDEPTVTPFITTAWPVMNCAAADEAANTAERREPALEEQIKSLRQVSELLHDVRATGII